MPSYTTNSSSLTRPQPRSLHSTTVFHRGLRHVEYTGLVLSAIVAADGDKVEGEGEEEEEGNGAGLDMSGSTFALGVVNARPASM
jgi:hypothetical protein